MPTRTVSVDVVVRGANDAKDLAAALAQLKKMPSFNIVLGSGKSRRPRIGQVLTGRNCHPRNPKSKGRGKARGTTRPK